MTFFQNIKDFLSYKEPPNIEQFELLEAETEDINESGAEKKQGSNKLQDTDTKKVNYISSNLNQNRQKIEQEFNLPLNKDIVIRDIHIGKNTEAFIVFIDGMTDNTTVNDFILRPLMTENNFKNTAEERNVDFIIKNVLTVNQINKAITFDDVITQTLKGFTVLFVHNCNEAVVIDTRGFEKRSVEQPVNESVISGPHEAFTENLRTNLTLVRKIIKNKDLVTELIPLGKTNHLNCGIMYINGIANKDIVNELKRRLGSLDIDFVMGDGMINQLIEDHPFAIFPQILSTERPDRTASFLMEGKVIFICDGAPYASAIPVTFFHMFHTSEDSFSRWQYGTFIRLIRLMGFWLALLLPGVYIAITLYHPEMIPTELLLAIELSRESVPFPVILEILLMEVSFELIREAGVRVPDVIGQTLGIIGALILGQSSVAANLVSPILVIIVSITGLGSFAMPNYNLGLAIRILKFLFIFLGFFAGFYGISMGLFVFGGLACSMKCFGIPYFAPVAPKTKVNPDVIIRQPIWKQTMRSDPINSPNERRAGKIVRGWVNHGKRGNKK